MTDPRTVTDQDDPNEDEGQPVSSDEPEQDDEPTPKNDPVPPEFQTPGDGR